MCNVGVYTEWNKKRMKTKYYNIFYILYYIILYEFEKYLSFFVKVLLNKRYTYVRIEGSCVTLYSDLYNIIIF